MYNRPVLVEFMMKEDADYLLNNRTYLPSGVYINREYSKETEEKHRTLRPYFKAARKLPKYHKKCRLDGDTLVIKGVSYTVSDLHRLPEELIGENICSISDQNNYGFFGKLHPFSNFHETSFTFQGLDYHSSEQMIQHLKATYFGDEDTVTKIMEAPTPLECKKLAREIDNYNQHGWNSIAKEMCESGIKLKFDQNPTLKQTLMKTKGKTIVECSTDELWGTGVLINDPQALKQNRWINQGILGEMLEDI